MNCVICKDKILVENNGWWTGYNAEPLADGRCCLACDETIVIEARLINMAYTLDEAHDISTQLRGMKNG